MRSASSAIDPMISPLINSSSVLVVTPQVVPDHVHDALDDPERRSATAPAASAP